MGKFDNLIGYIFTSNQYGDFVPYEYIGNGKYKVRFIDTGYETEAYRQNINSGAVKDQTIVSVKYKIGMLLDNIDGDKMEILKIWQEPRGKTGRLRSLAKVKFISTEYITTIHLSKRKTYQVKDYLKPSVHNVGCLGYVNDIEGKLRDMSEYRLWAGIMERCYSEHADKELSYIDATTSERWKRFDYFLEDIVKIEGYDKWKQYKINHPNEKNIYELDKDTKVLGNKVYSLETCRFIPKELNAGFTSWAKSDTKQNLLNKINKL